MRKPYAPLSVGLGLLIILAGCSNPQKAAREHVERGDRYLSQNKLPEAILQYRNAVQKDPMLGDARKKLGLAQRRTGNFKAALSQLVRAADLMPDDNEAQLAAGALLLQSEQFEDAAGRAQRVLARDPKNVDAHLLKANASAGLRDLEAAVTQIEEAIALDPDRTAAYANLGVLEAVRGRHAEAEAAFLKAVEVAPNDIEPRLALANYYWSTGRKHDAEEALNAALRIDAKNLAANRAMAIFQLVSGNAAGAEAHFKTVVANSSDAAPRLTLADFYLTHNRSAEAAPLLEELAKRTESFAAATGRLAGMAYERGERDNAHAMLDSVLAKDPRNVQVLFVKGNWQLAEGKIDEAEQTASIALKADAESAQAHQLAGTVAVRRGKIDAAIVEFQEVLKINPKAVSAQLQLAQLQEAKGDAGAARQHALDAVKLAPQSGAARYALARSLMASGDIDSAERELAPLAKVAPNSYEVLLTQGRIAFARGDRKGGTALIERAVAAQPTGLEALNILIGIYVRGNNIARAKELSTTALRAKPDDAALMVLAAKVEAEGGDLSSAEARLRRAIEVSPDYLPSYETLARMYVRQRKLDAALAEYERLVGRTPNSVSGHTMIAMIHEIQGRRQNAVAAYRRILDIDSRAVVANNNLAYIYAEQNKDLDMALQMAQTAKAASPDDPDVNDTLGWVYYKKGMVSQAVAPLIQSIQIQPSKPLYHYHLGLAYEKNGDRDKAKASLERALSLGDFAEATEARRALDALR